MGNKAKPDYLAGIREKQTEDEADAVRWLRDASNEDFKRVYRAIEEMRNDDEPLISAISRFAMLGLIHAHLLSRAT